jgi:hypothetical protein
MDHQRKTSMVFGGFLVLLGVWFLLAQFVPGLRLWIDASNSWPLFVIGTGVFLLFLGGVLGVPEMAIPACIVGGIGGLLYWQNATGRWETWAYAWALIPGFVGLGIMIAGLFRGEGRGALRAGGALVFISLVLFAVFGYFLGGSQVFGLYWPVALILLGLWMLVRRFMRWK